MDDEREPDVPDDDPSREEDDSDSFDLELSDDGSDDASDEGEDLAYAPPAHVFFENEPLIRALNDPRRGAGDQEVATRLFDALVQATLIAMVAEEEDDLDEDEVRFVLVQHPEVKGEIVPMFTDEGSLTAFAPDGGKYIALSVPDLFPLLAAGGDGPPNIVVNPGGDEALLLTPRMVQDVIDSVRGHVIEVQGHTGPIVVGEPKEPLPSEAGTEVTAVLERHPAVLRCLQLQWYVADRHETPSLVLAMDLDPDVTGNDRRLAMTHLWRELSPVLRTLGRTVEMVDLDAQREVFGDIAGQVEPLYERAA